MEKQTQQKKSGRNGSKNGANQRRGRQPISELLSTANRRAHERANRRGGRREFRSVQAAIADAAPMDDAGVLEWTKRLLRWIFGLLLLPVCWITTWTFLSRFSYAAMHQGFWQTPEFWYFATGILLMAGWFWSGLLRDLFLYFYVLGHELTHAVFVLIHFGKVTDFHVSTNGGYITTNKTNLLIALSPYFVPFWSIVGVAAYLLARLFFGQVAELENLLYAAVGYTWGFHMLWTLWMLPRDQPDLQEHGVFLSLIVIYLANLLVLVALLCLADAQLESFRDFGREWLRDAATWGDLAWRWCNELIRTVEARLMLPS